MGPGAEALGLEHGQIAERRPYDLPFGGRKAPDGTQLGKPPGSGRQAADVYARLLAADPHATAERKHELRTEDARCYVSRPASVSCTLPPFHWLVTSLAGLSWSREKRCSRPW